MKKTLLPLMLIFAMIFSLNTYAVDGKLSATTPTGTIGSSVEVRVNLDNPGIIGTRIFVSYDSKVLKLDSAENGDVFQQSQAMFGKDLSANPYIMLWDDSLNPSNNTKSGTLFVLKFTVKAGTSSGKTNVSIKVDDPSTFDTNLNSVKINGCTVGVNVPTTAATTTKPAATTTKPTTTKPAASTTKPTTTKPTTTKPATTKATTTAKTVTNKPAAPADPGLKTTSSAATTTTKATTAKATTTKAASTTAKATSKATKAETTTVRATTATSTAGTTNVKEVETTTGVTLVQAVDAQSSAPQYIPEDKIDNTLLTDPILDGTPAPEGQTESAELQKDAERSPLLWLLLLIPVAAVVVIVLVLNKKKKK